MKTVSTSVVVLALVSMLGLFRAEGGVPPATGTGGDDVARQALIQLTAQNQVLGFRSDGWFASNGSYVLHVGFVGAHGVPPHSEAASAAPDRRERLERVSYANLWDGIDLAYRATPAGIAESVYTIAPGADASAIRLRYDAPVELRADGTLSVRFSTGAFSESAPIAWQEIDGRRIDVPVAFAVEPGLPAGDSRVVSFRLGAYDERATLYIDPTLDWNTFYGPQAQEEGYDVAVDAMGNSYYLGASSAVWNPFPSPPVRPYSSGDDAFVLKLDPDGNPLWLTFLGGAGTDFGFALELYASDARVVVTGRSSATWGTPVRPYSQGGDGWVAQLSTATGALEWNTFLGGTSNDEANHVSVVESGGGAGIYVAGSTAIAVTLGGVTSQWGAPVRDQSTFGEGFAAKLALTGALVWNTFLGGGGADAAWGIDVLDSAVYVVGQSGPWGSGPAPQGCPGCPLNPYVGLGDAFVARLDAMTGNLVWNTFYGGPRLDVAYDVKAAGTDVYVVGSTSASWGSPVLPYVGQEDAFAARLSDAGALLANTFFGSGRNDRAQAVDVEGGRLYVGGRTTGSWGTPVRPYSGNSDMFVAGLDPSTLALQWNGFYGGPGSDGQDPIVGLDATPDGIWIAGRTANVRGTPDASWGAGECPGCPLEPFFFQAVGEFQTPSETLFAARLPSTVADLEIEKVVNHATTVAGLPLSYTITVSNHGPDDVGSADVTDNLPSAFTGATWTCTAAGGASCDNPNGSGDILETVNLPIGGSVTFSVDGTVETGFVGNLVNTASVSADVADPNPANDSDDAGTVVIRLSDLRISKDDSQTVAAPGAMTTYFIVVTNDGPSDAAARLTDVFPADYQNPTWTCTIGGTPCVAGGSGNIDETFLLAPGEQAIYIVQGTISAAATGILTNTASVGLITGTEFTPSNNTATDTTSLSTAADLSLSKTDGVKVVTAGGSTTYTITAANAGPSNVTSATVADTFPAALTCNWTCMGSGGGTCTAMGSGNINDSVDLPNGASVTYTAMCAISGGASGTIENTATVTSSVYDFDPTNNSQTDRNGVNEAADLIVVKSDGRLVATAGEATIYAIAVTNLGPSNVTGATVTDNFPAELQNVTWTCTAQGGATCGAPMGSGDISESVNLPANASVEFTISAKIDPATTSTSVSNTASVSSAVPELDPTNNSATDSTDLLVGADLLVLKSDGQQAALGGDTLTYNIIVANEGPSDEPNATIDDLLPSPLTNATWSCQASGGAVCPASNGGGSIHATGVHLPAGGQLLYVVTGEIRSTFSGTLSNTATVTPSVTDPVVANNSSTDDTEVFLPESAFAPPAPAPALGVVGSCVAVLILLLVAAMTLRRAGLVGN